MSFVRCTVCTRDWNASFSPLCIRCECQRLMSAPGLISDKHDPRLLPLIGISYRSCLSQDFVDNAGKFIEYATISGSWFYSTVHDTWNHFTPEPLGRIPGSGIHAGNPAPDHALDGLFIANALVDPHAYAVDQVRVRRQIHGGEFVPLWRCARKDCGNLCIPGSNVCALHTSPRLADPDE